jgi:MOSC domain-containing protein YiiM
MTPTHRPNNVGVVLAIARRATDGDPMHEVDQCTLLAGRGIDTENRKAGKREVTLLSRESWAEACRQLGAELPWTHRRANLLIEGVDLAAAIGKTLAVGEVRIRIHGETKPCGLMDEQHEGLREALVPSQRGGVHGQLLVGGVVRVGERVVVEPAD